MSSLQEKMWEIKTSLKKIRKSTKGFKFMYTNLSDVEKNIRPELVKHKLGYLHGLRIVDGKNVLTTKVFEIGTANHIIAEMVVPENVILAGMNGYQSLGSAITYFRRYQLTTMFGILTDEDVDALKQEETPPPKVDHIAKIKQLVSIGRAKPTLEKYYGTYKSKMEASEAVAIMKIIQDFGKQ
jgi:hypothetical protein